MPTLPVVLGDAGGFVDFFDELMGDAGILDPTTAEQKRAFQSNPCNGKEGEAAKAQRRSQFGWARSSSAWERKTAMARVRLGKFRKASSASTTQLATQVVNLYRRSSIRRKHRLNLLVPPKLMKKVGTASKTSLKVVFRGEGKRRGGPVSRAVPFDEALEVAYAGLKVEAAAAKHGIHASFVRLLRQFVASTYLWWQEKFLRGLLREATERPPAVCAYRLAFDETGQRLTLPTRAGGQGRATWQVMQCRLRMILGWLTAQPGTGDRVPQVYDFNLVLPPLLVSSTNAEHLSLAFRQPWVSPVFLAISELCRKAAISLELTETDSAASNQRLFAARLMTVPGTGEHAVKFLMCPMYCSLHQNQLIEALLLHVLSKKLLSSLYSMTLLFQNGGHYVRMVNVLPRVVEQQVVVRRVATCGPPPREAVSFADQALSYFLTHYRRFQRIREASSLDSEPELDIAPASALRELFEKARARRRDKACRKQERRGGNFDEGWWEYVACRLGRVRPSVQRAAVGAVPRSESHRLQDGERLSARCFPPGPLRASSE